MITLIRLARPWIPILALALAVGAVAQSDPYGFNLKGFIQNGIGEECWYTQTFEETNPILLVPDLQNMTGQHLRTITFDDPGCMADVLDGLGGNEDINKMMINNIVTNWFRGTYFTEDVRFDTRTLHPPAEVQARGECLQERENPNIAIYIEYLSDRNSITGVRYMRGLFGSCGE